MNQEYDLAEERKVVTPAHLDGFVKCDGLFFVPQCFHKKIGLVSILLWLVYATQSTEVRNHVVKLVICCESAAKK